MIHRQEDEKRKRRKRGRKGGREKRREEGFCWGQVSKQWRIREEAGGGHRAVVLASLGKREGPQAVVKGKELSAEP